jgi:putative hydrolase of the HAD superfamily
VKAPRALCFDLDGTLLDGSGNPDAIARACARIADATDGLTGPELHQANNDVWLAYWPEVEDDWTLGRVDSETLSTEAWRRSLRLCGCDDESVAGLAYHTFAEEMRTAMRLFDDVQDALTLLKPRYALALLTNGAAGAQREKLRVLGIEQLFDSVVISAEVGFAKPGPEVFRAVLDKLGVEPADVWHVGDNLHSDVAGAKASGLTAVWLNRHGIGRKPGGPEPDYEVQGLPELLSLPVLSQGIAAP